LNLKIKRFVRVIFFFSEPEVEVENFLISIDGVSESVEQGENSLPNIFSRKRNLPNSGFKTPKRVINVPLKDEDIGSFQEGVYQHLKPFHETKQNDKENLEKCDEPMVKKNKIIDNGFGSIKPLWESEDEEDSSVERDDGSEVENIELINEKTKEEVERPDDQILSLFGGKENDPVNELAKLDDQKKKEKCFKNFDFDSSDESQSLDWSDANQK